MIKKLELDLLVDIILLKMEFGHVQISAPKIGTRMSKTACINPWQLYQFIRAVIKGFKLSVVMIKGPRVKILARKAINDEDFVEIKEIRINMWITL